MISFEISEGATEGQLSAALWLCYIWDPGWAHDGMRSDIQTAWDQLLETGFVLIPNPDVPGKFWLLILSDPTEGEPE